MLKAIPEELPARGTVALVVAAEAGNSSKEVGDSRVWRQWFGLANFAKFQRKRFEHHRVEERLGRCGWRFALQGA